VLKLERHRRIIRRLKLLLDICWHLLLLLRLIALRTSAVGDV
jgi:hypothetical protein